MAKISKKIFVQNDIFDVPRTPKTIYSLFWAILGPVRAPWTWDLPWKIGQTGPKMAKILFCSSFGGSRALVGPFLVILATWDPRHTRQVPFWTQNRTQPGQKNTKKYKKFSSKITYLRVPNRKKSLLTYLGPFWGPFGPPRQWELHIK